MLIFKIIFKLSRLLWMYVEDFWKPVLGYIFIISGMITLAVVFPYIIILYILGIGIKLVKA